LGLFLFGWGRGSFQVSYNWNYVNYTCFLQFKIHGFCYFSLEEGNKQELVEPACAMTSNQKNRRPRRPILPPRRKNGRKYRDKMQVSAVLMHSLLSTKCKPFFTCRSLHFSLWLPRPAPKPEPQYFCRLIPDASPEVQSVKLRRMLICTGWLHRVTVCRIGERRCP
jgi:hypothetical protein